MATFNNFIYILSGGNGTVIALMYIENMIW